MSRQALLVVLAALVAALSFAVVGATIDGSRPSPSVQSEGGEFRTPPPRPPAGAGNVTRDARGTDSATAVPERTDGINAWLAAYLPAVNPLVLLGVTALVVAALWWFGVRSRSRGEQVTRDPETERDRAGDEAGADDASMAVPDAAVDNEVYRAWRGMVRELDVPYGESTTPREFAREAIEAGADSAAVRRLTDLFDRVRYGAVEPTDERERAARDALAAVEDGDGE